MWDMFSTHLTYDVQQQCHMIPKVLTRLQNALDVPDRLQVVAGDMNTYMTAEWPMDFWQNPWGSFSLHPTNPCFAPFQAWRDSQGTCSTAPGFSDVWDEAFPRQQNGKLQVRPDERSEVLALGHTFPVFKDSPQTNCRPDRILRRRTPGVELLDIRTFGDEAWYYESDTQRNQPQYLSDHLGVLVTLDLAKK